MKIIVTGGAGFLGSHLCDKLIGLGHQVICIDNLLTGSEKNIEHLRQNPNFQFINHDVSKDLPENFQPQISNVKFIYHLASPASPNTASPKSYHALGFETMQVNTNGTWNMCELATKLNAKLLFASTSECYGDPLEHPQKEDYRGNVSTTGPRAVYDEAKRFGETIVSAFVKSKQLDGRIIRIFNTYGPRMAKDDGRVITEFISAALKNEPLPIFGDGSQTRSFCYVSDLIDGIYAAMNSENTTGEVFNLGNPKEFAISELADIVIRITDSRSTAQNIRELPEDDPKQRCPDITKAKRILRWEPSVNLEEGLVLTIKYWSGNLGS